MLAEVLKHALLITGFVFVMMLAIEYLNVLTRGRWDALLRRRRGAQILVAALLGSMPGCLGAFAAVSFYQHRVIGFGALVAAMIAASGDEAYVMLALFPGKALLIMLALFAVGVVSGYIVDAVLRGRMTGQDPHPGGYPAVHEEEVSCVCFSPREWAAQWRRCSPQRGLLAVFLALFLVGILTGAVGHHDLGVPCAEHDHHEWNWVRIMLLVTSVLGLGIVATVPDHFLEQHLWNHLVRVHVWRTFLWTFAALLAMHVLLERLPFESLAGGAALPLLLSACLLGLIPESGPHLVFVTLYASGALPLSVLLASSIVQDGHGMLPMLAHSRRGFLAVKAVNFAVGLAVGLAGHLLGW